MNETAVATQSLGKRFAKNWAVRDLTLEIPAGGVFGLLGRNGAGKTTVFALLTGLLKPTQGDAVIFGHSIETERKHVLNSVGYVDEEKTLYGYLRVGQMLELAKGLAPRWSDQLAAKHVRVPVEKRVRDLSRGSGRNWPSGWRLPAGRDC